MADDPGGGAIGGGDGFGDAGEIGGLQFHPADRARLQHAEEVAFFQCLDDRRGEFAALVDLVALFLKKRMQRKGACDLGVDFGHKECLRIMTSKLLAGTMTDFWQIGKRASVSGFLALKQREQPVPGVLSLADRGDKFLAAGGGGQTAGAQPARGWMVGHADTAGGGVQPGRNLPG